MLYRGDRLVKGVGFLGGTGMQETRSPQRGFTIPRVLMNSWFFESNPGQNQTTASTWNK